SVTVGKGRVDLIMGPIAISGSSGRTAVVIDDSKDPTRRDLVLSPTAFSGVGGGIGWSTTLLASLTVSAGQAGNRVVVSGTSTATTVNTGAATDQVFVLGTRAGSPLTINGQGGADNVNVGFAGSVQPIAGMLTITNA